MILPNKNGKPDIPQGATHDGYVYIAELDAFRVKNYNDDALRISRFQFEAELEERNLHGAVMGMLEQLAQTNRKVELWLTHGTFLYRWSDKVIELSEALQSQGINLDLDDFFAKAKQIDL